MSKPSKVDVSIPAKPQAPYSAVGGNGGNGGFLTVRRLHSHALMPKVSRDSRAAVWAAWTTKPGMEAWQVAHAEIDLKVGSKIRTHYDAKGTIGDPNTIENVILSFEPNKFMSIRVGKPPEKFPFKEAIKSVWHVIYLEDAGPGRTRVRVVGLGYGSDDESKKMRGFFAAGNAYTLKKLQEHFAGK